MDTAICILKLEDGKTVKLYETQEFINGRDCELETQLELGQYIIIPKTNGVNLKRPLDA